MPELPEVETVRRQLAPAVAGRRVTAAWGFESPKFAPAGTLEGAALGAVRRRGKYLLVDVDGGARELVVHLGMTGALGLLDAAAPVDDYVRAWWTLDDGSRLELRDVRRFGRVAVVARGDHRALPTLAALGPEPFSPAFTAEGLWEALRRSRVRVKTQLLHQRVVAGVGNIYADEALWRAGVHPARRRVARRAATALHGAIRGALCAGIANGGTTFRDFRGFDGGTGRHQEHLDCYGRAGEPCRRCGTTLVRRIVDQRGTTFCPRCQPA